MPAPTFYKVSQASRREVDFPGRIRSPLLRLMPLRSPGTYIIILLDMSVSIIRDHQRCSYIVLLAYNYKKCVGGGGPEMSRVCAIFN